MFRVFAILSISCILLSLTSFIQTSPVTEVTEAIRKGDAESLGKYFNDMVDLNIPGFKDSYSKSQGSRIIRDFFSSRPVSNVVVNKDGTSPDGSKFIMGNITAGGKKYNLYFLMRKNQGEFRIYLFQLQTE